jgi:hypothetical protein
MASDEKRELVRAIAPTLKAHAFKKKDATWHRTRDGFIQTFNVQGSQWSKSFYLNLGIYIMALGDETTPPECHRHIRNRVGEVAADRTRYNELLDLETSIPSEERFKELNKIIESKAIPWLEEFSDDRSIIDWISGKQPHGLPILKSVFEHYGIERNAKQNKSEH